MASWREIERFKKDSAASRALASTLLRAHEADLTDWELAFLRSHQFLDESDDRSTRQAEKLLEIRDAHQPVSEVRGFSVLRLLDGCYAARLDLSEDDEEWIVAFRASGRVFKRRDAGRLLRCARTLNIIETQDA